MLLLLQTSASSVDWRLLANQALQLLVPETLLTLFACAALVLDVILPHSKKRYTAYFCLAGIGFSGAALLQLYGQLHNSFPISGFYNMFVVDGFAVVFKAIFLLAAAISIALAIKYLDVEEEQHGEYYSLILFATIGMMFIASGADLLTLFVSLELMALSVYVLVGYLKRDRKSNEAAMKYFLLGAFSSGILLYGISLLYGVTGTTNLNEISSALPGLLTGEDSPRFLLLLAMILLAAGLCFKVAAVPFHMWAPDAYEGAPTSVTAFMSVGPKAAAYALFARIFLDGIGPMYSDWVVILGVVSAITMTWGNFAAATQNNTKRLLAYSSISHAGYILLGLVAGNEFGYTGIVIYLLVYVLMNTGAFGVIIALRRRGVIGDQLDDLNGLIKTHPGTTIMMTIFLLSLAGIPPTAGFIGKYYLFGGLIKTGNPWLVRLAVLAVLNTAVSLYYYARFMRAMFMGEASEAGPLSFSPSWKIALGVAVALTVFIGVYPQPFIDLSSRAITHLTPYFIEAAATAAK